eukprot:1314634-Amphidinium_carterae.1
MQIVMFHGVFVVHTRLVAGWRGSQLRSCSRGCKMLCSPQHKNRGGGWTYSAAVNSARRICKDASKTALALPSRQHT